MYHIQLQKDRDDLPRVRAIQEGMRVTELAGALPVCPQDDGDQPVTVPIAEVRAMDLGAFFARANALMRANPPAPADAPMMEMLAPSGVGPGLDYSGPTDAESEKAVKAALFAEVAALTRPYGVALGRWFFFGKPIGDFETAYDYRAAIAVAGLGANPVEIAIYPRTDRDADGAPLTGQACYDLRMAELPPVLAGGFWSITAYGDDDFLIANSRDRYAVNDRSLLTAGADGSVTIRLSAETPPDVPDANWLPVGRGGFHLVLRIYSPDMAALQGWTPPVIAPVVLKNNQ